MYTSTYILLSVWTSLQATHIMLNVFKNIPKTTNAVVYCYYMNSHEDKWTKEVSSLDFVT